jgi:hypothetical protein
MPIVFVFPNFMQKLKVIKNERIGFLYRSMVNRVTRRIKEELSAKVEGEQLRSITNFAKELDDAINIPDMSNIKTKIEILSCYKVLGVL